MDHFNFSSEVTFIYQLLFLCSAQNLGDRHKDRNQTPRLLRLALSKWSLAVTSTHKNHTCTSRRSHTCYMPHPSQACWFDHPNKARFTKTSIGTRQ